MSDVQLLRLLQLADPALPVGAYAHSLGLETYVQQGSVHNSVTAEAFIRGMLTHSCQYTDGAFVSLAHAATDNDDITRILQLDAECHAVKLPMEIRQGSIKLGMRLLKLFEPLCPADMVCRYRGNIEEGTAYGHYSITFGLFASVLKISRSAALTGFYYNAAAGMVTNSVKLIPLGQRQGQELLFSLQPLIMQLVENSLHPDESLIGLSCIGSDIRCMQHEQLYSRLYMS